MIVYSTYYSVLSSSTCGVIVRLVPGTRFFIFITKLFIYMERENSITVVRVIQCWHLPSVPKTVVQKSEYRTLVPQSEQWEILTRTIDSKLEQ
jgi:hypothetical protein